MWHFLLLSLLVAWTTEARSNVRRYSKAELKKLKNEAREMFQFAYDGYLKHAYPYDELRPLSCDGVDTWGSYSLTLIDALDTLAVMGNYSEFQRVYNIISEERHNFDSDINVSVFETNIRIVGGLLGAHMLAKRAKVDVEPGWPCNGPLLRLAEDVAIRLLPAFDTATGMPYGTVNLRHGVPKGETSVTCTASVGTFIVEFGTLSRLTGNPLFEETALRALRSLWNRRSNIGLFGNHIDVETGKWTATDAGIGAGVDSFYEYLVKGAALLQRPELMRMFEEGRRAVEQYLNHDDWYFWATMKQGSVTMPLFQSLEAFWPGLLTLVGDTQSAMKSIHNYQQVYKQYGFLPEFYNVGEGVATEKRDGYPLRPELVESAMYLYKATKDPIFLTIGEDVLRSIQHSSKTECGYATVKSVLDHTLENRMESFFLSETTKYLFLLFDTDNFLHNSGHTATVLNTKHGECIVDAGGYVFNTEAHPMDPATLQCCTGHTFQDIQDHIDSNIMDIISNPSKLKDFTGETVPARIQLIEQQRRSELKKREEEKKKYEMKLHEQRLKRREDMKKKAVKLEQNTSSVPEENAGSDEEGEKEENENYDDSADEETNERQEENSCGEKTPDVAEQEHAGREEEEAALCGEQDKLPIGEDTTSEKVNEKAIDLQDEEPIASEQNEVEKNALHGMRNEENSAEQEESENEFNPAGEEQAALVREQNKLVVGEDATNEKDLELQGEESCAIEPNQESEDENEPIFTSKAPKCNTEEATSEAVGNSDAIHPAPDERGNIGNELLGIVDKLSNFFEAYHSNRAAKVFDIEEFRYKVMEDRRFDLNETWYADHSVLSCPAKHFLERFSYQGEIFDSN